MLQLIYTFIYVASMAVVYLYVYIFKLYVTWILNNYNLFSMKKKKTQKTLINKNKMNHNYNFTLCIWDEKKIHWTQI